jgi:hypothetical protein
MFRPYALELTPTMSIIVFAIGFAAQVVITLDIQGALRRAQIDAQNRVHAQRWHLEKVLPRS